MSLVTHDSYLVPLSLYMSARTSSPQRGVLDVLLTILLIGQFDVPQGRPFAVSSGELHVRIIQP
jgi:hypothetical protein